MSATLLKDVRQLGRLRAFRVLVAGYALAVSVALVFPYSLATNAARAALPAWLIAAQWVLLSLSAPWIVCRLTSLERGDALADLALRSGAQVSSLVGGKALAAVVFLAELLMASLPAAVVAYLAAPVTVGSLAGDYLELALFGAFAVPLSLHVVLGDEHRLRSWALATVIVAAAAAVFRSIPIASGPGPALAALVAACAVAWTSLVRRSDRRLFSFNS